VITHDASTEGDDEGMISDANHCARCKRQFEEGITVWRVPDGWIHPECASDMDRAFMNPSINSTPFTTDIQHALVFALECIEDKERDAQ
jgi:hypothetical protein